MHYYRKLLQEKTDEHKYRAKNLLFSKVLLHYLNYSALLYDKNGAKILEMRRLVSELETECQRLRELLRKSIPESEFFHEKGQYLAVIDKLVEENMQMRQIIGDYEQRRMG